MPKSLHLLTAIRCVHWIACSYSVPQRFARTNIAKSVAKMASARNALTGMKPMMMANVNVSWLLVSTWFVAIASQNTLPRIFLHIIYKICITIFLYKFSKYVIDTTRWWLLPSLSEHLLILPLQELFSFKFLWIYCWELDLIDWIYWSWLTWYVMNITKLFTMIRLTSYKKK